MSALVSVTIPIVVLNKS